MAKSRNGKGNQNCKSTTDLDRDIAMFLIDKFKRLISMEKFKRNSVSKTTTRIICNTNRQKSNVNDTSHQ